MISLIGKNYLENMSSEIYRRMINKGWFKKGHSTTRIHAYGWEDLDFKVICK